MSIKLKITSENYKESYIKLMLHYGALKFGNFVTKSGRSSPYFINTGSFDSGFAIEQVGQCYAHHIRNLVARSNEALHLYGPAYKGIPLCVAVATQLAKLTQNDVKFTFNRKEIKNHGEGGSFVGAIFSERNKVFIIEDVMTGATSIRETFEFFEAWNQSKARPAQQLVKVGGVFVGVDRQEIGPMRKTSAKDYVEQTFKIPVYPIVNILEILSVLTESGQVREEFKIDAKMIQNVSVYLQEYGA